MAFPFLQILSNDLVLAHDHLHSFHICIYLDSIFHWLHSIIETAKHLVAQSVIFNPRMEDPTAFTSHYPPAVTAWSVEQGLNVPMLHVAPVLPQFLSAHPPVSPVLGSSSSSPIVIEDKEEGLPVEVLMDLGSLSSPNF
ncbi:hypothetical protein GYMLUDRAFT_57657 [Collybiopsis luxurians FD-317 M1]|uniref:Uncharacterized protein n=1 Tax=Collybiopsis luxurians FD-317 M1 TaxID=944289 RepID=A0A0D0D2L9_9AGAR|nr:hypothetical protein GYMLUDRAFT_57657 [Collybiopsis luxurians FD-317 M1]